MKKSIQKATGFVKANRIPFVAVVITMAIALFAVSCAGTESAVKDPPKVVPTTTTSTATTATQTTTTGETEDPTDEQSGQTTTGSANGSEDLTHTTTDDEVETTTTSKPTTTTKKPTTTKAPTTTVVDTAQPTEPPKIHQNPEVVQPADPDTGISWDGKSPIVYTYEDGTTGTEKKDGATYELLPGLLAGVTIFDDNHKEWDGRCSYCGKQAGDGCNNTCVRWMMSDVDCPHCGEHVPVNTCHSCQ